MHAQILYRYESVQEYVQSIFDRQFHYMDQMLHKGALPAHEAEFREEISKWLVNLSPEGAFERVKSKRADFIAHPYQCEYPFVLRHGDLHGRNVVVRYVRLSLSGRSASVNPTFSRSSPRRILAIIDWDFGGSHALPFADQAFEPSWPDSDETDDVREKQAEEAYNCQLLIDKLAGALPYDTQLIRLVYSTRWDILDREAPKASGKDPSACLADSGVNVVGSVPDDTEA